MPKSPNSKECGTSELSDSGHHLQQLQQQHQQQTTGTTSSDDIVSDENNNNTNDQTYYQRAHTADTAVILALTTLTVLVAVATALGGGSPEESPPTYGSCIVLVQNNNMSRNEGGTARRFQNTTTVMTSEGDDGTHELAQLAAAVLLGTVAICALIVRAVTYPRMTGLGAALASVAVSTGLAIISWTAPSATTGEAAVVWVVLCLVAPLPGSLVQLARDASFPFPERLLCCSGTTDVVELSAVGEAEGGGGGRTVPENVVSRRRALCLVVILIYILSGVSAITSQSSHMSRATLLCLAASLFGAAMALVAVKAVSCAQAEANRIHRNSYQKNTPETNHIQPHQQQPPDPPPAAAFTFPLRVPVLNSDQEMFSSGPPSPSSSGPHSCHVESVTSSLPTIATAPQRHSHPQLHTPEPKMLPSVTDSAVQCDLFEESNKMSRARREPSVQMIDPETIEAELNQSSGEVSGAGAVVVAPLRRRQSRVMRHADLTIDTESTVNPMAKPERWKLGAEIGRGAYGTVHIAFNHDTGVLMAVKNIQFDASDTGLETKLKELQNEIVILKKLNHHNIVRYFFAERAENGVFIGMEYVPGGSIRDVLRNFGPLQEDVVVDYTHQLLFILAYLHHYGIVHRDVKSANVMVTADGTVKLGDFGSAQSADRGPVGIGGTPCWMAPELLRGTAVATPASDIWSLGCTVMEMLTADLPWAHVARDPAAILEYVIDDTREIVLPDTLSPESTAFLSDCLQRDPSMRPTPQTLLEHHYFWEKDDIELELREETEKEAVAPTYVLPLSPRAGDGGSDCASPSENPFGANRSGAVSPRAPSSSGSHHTGRQREPSLTSGGISSPRRLLSASLGSTAASAVMGRKRSVDRRVSAFGRPRQHRLHSADIGSEGRRGSRGSELLVSSPQLRPLVQIHGMNQTM
eukprot:PhM_4_TR7467/c0_g1_i1/m.29944